MSDRRETSVIEPDEINNRRETKLTEPKQGLVTLYEHLFWDEDDPRQAWYGNNPSTTRYGTYSIDLDVDSFIWCFCGGRGSGKTTSLTYFALKAWLVYGMRLLSNFPIECMIKLASGKVVHVVSEPLDLYRLLCFDEDYRECLILIDEAPDIISHLAANTWKNRLLNIFVRQLRKNRNSLFMAAQNFGFIDKSMRWQTDILVDCQDASRKYGWPKDQRGRCILMDFKDNSGVWTGRAWDDRNNDNGYIPYSFKSDMQLELAPAPMWGIKGKTKPVYDTYYQQDVWESLRKVDMKLMTYEVGNRDDGGAGDGYIQQAAPVIEEYIRLQAAEPGRAGFFTKSFYASVGALGPKEKNALAKRMSNFGLKIGQDHAGQRYYDFSEFNLNGFLGA